MTRSKRLAQALTLPVDALENVDFRISEKWSRFQLNLLRKPTSSFKKNFEKDQRKKIFIFSLSTHSTRCQSSSEHSLLVLLE